MFAIRIKPENNEKIAQVLPQEDYEYLQIEWFLDRPRPWYALSGYTRRDGKYVGFSIMPGHVLYEKYQYNPDVIETDWDQIVRKEES